MTDSGPGRSIPAVQLGRDRILNSAEFERANPSIQQLPRNLT